MPLTFLSRSQFETACKLFLHKQGDVRPPKRLQMPDREAWMWRSHPVRPLISDLMFSSIKAALWGALQLGYLVRSITVIRHGAAGNFVENADSDFTEEDDAMLVKGSFGDLATVVQQYIVYSPTFGVPAFYFSAHDSNGTPLSLHDIVEFSGLFQKQAFPESAYTEPHAVLLPDSQFPLLSFGDHPVLGIPCWYFHPCQTALAVKEILEEMDNETTNTTGNGEDLLEWIEAWFLVLNSVVDLR